MNLRKKENETLNDYLTRIAPVLDYFRNGKDSEIDRGELDALSESDKQELESYLYEITKEDIDRATRTTAKLNGNWFCNCIDDFNSMLWVEVVKNLHKFNNPAYKKEGDKQEYAVDTFVNQYVKCVKRTVWCMVRGLKINDVKWENHVKRVISIIKKETGRDEDGISAEEIYENQHKTNDVLKLSLDEIRDVRFIMQGMLYEDALEGQEIPSYVDEYNKLDCSDIVDTFIESFNRREEYERYIYGQYMRLKDRRTTTKQISGDMTLINMLLNNAKVGDAIVEGGVYVERSKGNISQQEIESLKHLKYHIDETFIETTYRKVERQMISDMISSGYSMDEAEYCLEKLREVEEQLLNK